MNEELKQLIEQNNRHWEEMKSAFEREQEETKKLGSAHTETLEKIDKLNTAMEELETKIARFQAMDGGVSEGDGDPDVPEAKEAYLDWVRTGNRAPYQKYLESLEGAEQKVLLVSDDTTGGFLAPPEFVQMIIKGLKDMSDLRRFARTSTTGQRAVRIPTRTKVFGATWTGEAKPRADKSDDLRYGMEEVPVHTLTALLRISNEDLEDSLFDLEGELRQEMIEAFDVSEGAAFILGDKNGKPEGILQRSGITEISSGASGAIDPDALFDQFFGLKTGYSRNGVWLMRRETIRDIRKLKDAEDQYLWRPGLADGTPSTLLGAPLAEMPDMPVVAASTTPIAFGDWRRAYWIIDRLALQIVRDPLTEADDGVVRFIARRRVGAQVTLPEAYNLMRVDP